MELLGQSIRTWDDMKEKLLTKYRDYCKSRDAWEEVFMMSQKEEECYVPREGY